MFKKLSEKKQKVLRVMFGAISVTAMMFVFQACYGSPNKPDGHRTDKDSISEKSTHMAQGQQDMDKSSELEEKE